MISYSYFLLSRLVLIFTKNTVCRYKKTSLGGILLKYSTQFYEKFNDSMYSMVLFPIEQNAWKCRGIFEGKKYRKSRQVWEKGINNKSTCKSRKEGGGTRFPERQALSAGLPHQLQMLHKNISSLGKGQIWHKGHQICEESDRIL